METQSPKRTRSTRSAIIAGLLFVLAVSAVVGVGASYFRFTLAEMDRLQLATSDNARWTLPQVEVEYLSLMNALDQRDARGEADLGEIRLRYDILYSRVQTLRRSPVFEQLSQQDAFTNALDRVTQFLDQALPVIDGPDDTLRAALPTFSAAAEWVRPELRTISVAGLAYFSLNSDMRREQVDETLTQLAVVAVGLFLGLAALAVFLFFVYRKTDARGVALEQANHRMNTILSTSLDGVIVADTQGRVQEFNDAAVSIFEYSLQEVQNHHVGELLFPGTDGDERPRARDLAGRGRVQIKARRANAEIFPAELALQSAFDGEEEIIVGFVRDISNRVQAQQELVEARDRALAGEKAKDEFLAVMSHEIRTPLNGVLGNLSLLEDTRLSPQQAEYVHNMQISGNILMGHVDSVLDIARFESGKYEVTRDRLDLRHFLKDLTDGLRSVAQGQNSTLDWDWIGAPQHWVVTDRKALQQIVLNLTGNAIKFTRDGRVTIEVEMPPASVPVGDIQHLELRVCDTGIGIPPENLDRVFEDFHTKDPSFARATSGTGLGLGIARRLVHALDGEIGVESEQGVGSTFWVRIPVEICEAATDSPDTSAPGTALLPLDILVVEDNAINRQVVQNMLERDGHIVTCREDGERGVDAANAHAYDLILMDINMPVMDGLDATRLIRAGDGPCRDIPIIALSANVLPQDKARFEAAGMTAFLGKPLRPEDLRQVLARVKGKAAPDLLSELPGAPFGPSVTVDHATLSGLAEGLGPAPFAALLTRFVDEANGLVTDLEALETETAELSDLAARCHKIAGSAAVFGANSFRQTLLVIEHAALAEARDTLPGHLSNAISDWTATRSEMERELIG